MRLAFRNIDITPEDAIGTSVSRLSTYLSGKVMPSAALLVRMRQVATPRQG